MGELIEETVREAEEIIFDLQQRFVQTQVGIVPQSAARPPPTSVILTALIASSILIGAQEWGPPIPMIFPAIPEIGAPEDDEAPF